MIHALTRTVAYKSSHITKHFNETGESISFIKDQIKLDLNSLAQSFLEKEEIKEFLYVALDSFGEEAQKINGLSDENRQQLQRILVTNLIGLRVMSPAITYLTQGDSKGNPDKIILGQFVQTLFSQYSTGKDPGKKQFPALDAFLEAYNAQANTEKDVG